MVTHRMKPDGSWETYDEDGVILSTPKDPLNAKGPYDNQIQSRVMKFIVELLALGKPGEVREVDVPGMDHLLPYGSVGLKGTRPLRNSHYFQSIAQEVFLRGQNEEDPQDHPSVSAGDVIHIGEDRWLVLGVGFKKMTPNEYTIYREMPRAKRMIVSYLVAEP